MTKILRNDLQIISSMIKQNEKVLDVGCGNGNLIEFLSKNKNVDCKGVEIELSNMNICLKKGLSVVQGDANYDLNDFSDNSFSTVILSQTIQATIFPERVIKNLIRIGKRAIISFPNFGYWRIRKDFFFNGRMPKNDILPFEWFNTPNIHLCSVDDFVKFCKKLKITINYQILLNKDGKKVFFNKFMGNLLSYQVIFCVSKK
jgi:methionine biosynthesis protein MetW|tara:strand:- start:3265 stop:3870 length:606 start_codon:yes stop_codon:yes gene_type:complete